MPIARVVVNAVLPPLFSREERERLETLVVQPVDAGTSALDASHARAVRERVQADSLARLAQDLPIAPAFFPLLFEDAAHPTAIDALAKRLT